MGDGRNRLQMIRFTTDSAFDWSTPASASNASLLHVVMARGGLVVCWAGSMGDSVGYEVAHSAFGAGIFVNAVVCFLSAPGSTPACMQGVARCGSSGCGSKGAMHMVTEP